MKPNLVIFSGAGLSRESGIPTFRDSDGLWHGHRVEDVADHEAWQRNPRLVLDFYAARWSTIQSCEPNAAHRSIARLEQKFHVLNITQNIDDLLERAGCTNVWHLHGCINSRKCEWHHNISMYEGDPRFQCDFCEEQTDPVRLGERCPKCAGQLRPNVVWFGEAVDMRERFVSELAENTEVFIGVGTSAQVHPAADLLVTFRTAKRKYFVDLHPPQHATKVLAGFTILAGKATERLPRLVEDLLA